MRAKAAIDGQPNIIFIMSDDHAAHATSCYGSGISRTPNIDRLAEEGMRFTHALGVNSLCAPARANLLTGKHTHANGVRNNFTRFDGSQQTFPKLLQAAGYETAVIGKWHLKSEPTGFDYYNIMSGHGRYFDCPLREKGQDKFVVHKGYLTNVITDLSIDWLKSRSSGKPFCLMVHHKAPHGPDVHEERHARLYENQAIAEPPTLYDDWQTREPLATGRCNGTKLINCSWGQYRQLLSKLPMEKDERTRQFYQVFIKGYLRLIASLDENVGRLLNHVDASGLRQNTVVVYTSDNGFFMGDHGLFNKMWMYEESLHIPLIVRYPGVVESGAANRDLVTMLDFAPTFLDLVGAPIPSDLHGRSIQPLLEGKSPRAWRDMAYYRFYGGYEVPPHVGVRTRTHKLIHFPTFENSAGPYWELFDLQKDPEELRNVYDDPKYGPTAEEMKRQLQTLTERYGENVLPGNK
jgi:arylsulfatase A-like enzyme